MGPGSVMSRHYFAAGIVCAFFAGSLALAADSSAEKAAAILNKNCTGCHGAALKMWRLDLRRRESALTGGERGAALEPGKAENSRLYRFVAGLDQPSMPPGKTLSADQVATLKQWIDEGAPWIASKETTTDEGNAALAKLEERPITPAERNYWAFRAPVRPPVPADAKNPLDPFLLPSLQPKRLLPSHPPANPP